MKISKEYRFMVTAGSLFGLIIFWRQLFANLWLSTFEIAVLPYLPAIAILLPVLIRRKTWWKRAYIRPILVWWFIEAIQVITQFGWFYFHIPVAVILLLIYTQPLRTILFGYLFFRERIRRYHILACILVLWGIFLLINPFGSTFSMLGIIFGLLAGIFLSLRVIAWARVSRKWIDSYLAKFSETVTSLSFVWIIYFILLPFIHTPGVMSFSLQQTPMMRLYFFLFALFANVAAHVFYLKWVKKVSTISAGIIMLLEPVVWTILATIFFHQPLTRLMVGGWVLILLWNVFVMVYGQKRE